MNLIHRLAGLVLVGIVASQVNAGGHRFIPPLVPVEDSGKFNEIVRLRGFPHHPKDWTLLKVEPPVCYEGQPDPVFVFLTLRAPDTYSTIGFNYIVRLRYWISQDTLTNPNELKTLANLLQSQIPEFEQNHAIQVFSRLSGKPEFILRQAHFQTEVSESDYMSYNHQTDSIESYCFRTPDLVDSISLFAPKTIPVKQIAEIHGCVGLDRIEQSYGSLWVFTDPAPFKPRMKVGYDLVSGNIVEFELYDICLWDKIAVAGTAVRLMEDSTGFDELKRQVGCEGANIWIYGKQSKRDPDQRIDVTARASIVCGSAMHRWELSFIWQSDGTIQNLNID